MDHLLQQHIQYIWCMAPATAHCLDGLGLGRCDGEGVKLGLPKVLPVIVLGELVAVIPAKRRRVLCVCVCVVCACVCQQVLNMGSH